MLQRFIQAAAGWLSLQRWFLTAGRFGAAEALRIGLVHAVVPEADLSRTVDGILSELALCGPHALGEAKDLVFTVSRERLDEALVRDTVDRITRVRASDEAREGVGAFLEKRPPAWVKGQAPDES